MWDTRNATNGESIKKMYHVRCTSHSMYCYIFCFCITVCFVLLESLTCYSHVHNKFQTANTRFRVLIFNRSSGKFLDSKCYHFADKLKKFWRQMNLSFSLPFSLSFSLSLSLTLSLSLFIQPIP